MFIMMVTSKNVCLQTILFFRIIVVCMDLTLLYVRPLLDAMFRVLDYLLTSSHVRQTFLPI
jgi:hypothetical protein